MPSETPFRLTLLAVLVIVMSIIPYFRVQAAKSGEKISRRDEGLALAITLRVSALVFWLGTLVYLCNPEWMDWASLPLPHAVRWIGAATGVVGIALVYWTLSNLGKNLTDTVVTRQAATLVTSGPYRYLRHPFYLCVALLMSAVSLLSASWLMAACGTLCLVLLIVRTTTEEQKLIDKFGEPYRQYMATTGRFWPKLRKKSQSR